MSGTETARKQPHPGSFRDDPGSSGTFASSLTEHPFFAVILSFVFVVLLELAWPIAQITDPPLQPLLAYVALHTTHFSAFQRGLLQLSDVVFYVSLIYLSLLAATKVLQNRRFR